MMRILFSAIVGLLLIASSVGAQDLLFARMGPPNTLEFSFSNPGARSMGFGGAFAALADDATAAFANPAGLIQLARPELSLEGRLWSYSTPFTEGGRVTGQPTGFGLDSIPGLRAAESSEDLTGLSFLSFVYPRKSWALAVYRHQLAKFRSTAETQGLFGDSATPGFVVRFADSRVATDFEVVSLGLSAAWRWTERLSLGAGVALVEGESLSSFEAFLIDDPESLESFFAPISYLPERLIAFRDLRLDDSDWILNLGFLWRLAERWSLGGFFRQGPGFRLVLSELVSGPGLELFEIPQGRVLDGREEGPLQLPDVYGLGLAYRSAGGAVTVSLEWDRVEYSTILASIDPEADDETFTLDDADEVHLGFEYVFIHSQPIVALRLGAWLDPDHRFRFSGRDVSSADAVSRALFTGGDDKVHIAAGVGLAWQRFQVDLAIDLSDHRDTASISAIYSF